ncbi:MAG: hypothetical protein ACTSX9_08700 [Candidatus Njordarchaeales archaeon]
MYVEVYLLILGYILLSSGGVPIITDILIPFGAKEKREFLPMILGSISDLFNTMLKSRIKAISLQNYRLYMDYSEKYSVIIISDTIDPRLETISGKIVKMLEEADIDPLELQILPTMLEDLKNKVRELLLGSPPSLQFIRDILGEISEKPISESEKTPAKEFPNEAKITGKGIKLVTQLRNVTISDLLKMFYKGDLSKILESAPSLFGSSDNDLARILYAKAGLFLHMSTAQTDESLLYAIKGVVSRIKDSFAKRYLEAEILSFHSVTGYREIFQIISDNSSRINNMLSRNDILGDVYKLLLIPVPIMSILEKLQNHYEKTSPYLYSIIYEAKSLLVLDKGMEDLETRAYSILGTSKEKLNKFMKIKAPSITSYYLTLLSSLLHIILLSNMTYEEGSNIILETLNLFDKRWRKTIDKLKNQPIATKFANIYLAYGILYRFLIESKDERARKKLNRVESVLQSSLTELMQFYAQKKIFRVSYLYLLAGILSALSRIFIEKSKVSNQLESIVARALDFNAEQLWTYDRTLYLSYYINLLDTIGNIVIIKNREELSEKHKNLLNTIADRLAMISNTYTGSLLISCLSALRAVRFYGVIGSEAALEKSKNLCQSIMKRSSPFITSIITKLLQKRNVKNV